MLRMSSRDPIPHYLLKQEQQLNLTLLKKRVQNQPRLKLRKNKKKPKRKKELAMRRPSIKVLRLISSRAQQ